MRRYLLNISYIGSGFRGIQRNKVGEADVFDSTTVQGCLEEALKSLRPANPIQLALSSRTDAGVHALQSTVHIEFEKSDGDIYSTVDITEILNKQLNKSDIPIRVIDTVHVPNTFHCRFNAKDRTYLYRFAVSKVYCGNSDELKSRKYLAFIPIEEAFRCCFLQDPDFDIAKFKEVSQLFVGRHDFRTFMGMNKDIKKKYAPYTIRTITDIKIEKGVPLASNFDAQKAREIYDYWNINITGKSFLYRQVRRIVATLIAVGYSRITNKDVYEMLTVPSKYSWNSRIAVVPPYGLYLCKVRYDVNDLKFKNNCVNDHNL